MMIGVISLGCAKNRVDTERMLGLLRQAGHTFTNDPAKADILIVNTCGFIEPAKQESIDTILELAQYKESGRCRLLIATGCLTERYRVELAEALPELDILLGVREYDTLLPKIDAALGLDGNGAESAATDKSDETNDIPDGTSTSVPVGCRTERVLTTPPYSAFLRIGDGCNNKCAYCAIPLIRGPLKDEPLEDLLYEAEKLCDQGVTELTVIAQDTSGYGRERYGAPRLEELLSKLSQTPNLHWLRVLYTYPDTVTPRLIDFMRDNEKIVHYLDLPLQHISDPILTAMNRRGSGAYIRRIMEYTEKRAPDFILRTTMMVGFPGETETQFEELLAFLRDHPFDRVGAFAYSAEEGTVAAEMPNQIPEEVKAARLDALMRQQQPISLQRNKKRVGTVTEVLIESCSRRGATGRSYAEAPDDVDGKILLPHGKNLRPGQYVPVRLTDCGEYDMIGELI